MPPQASEMLARAEASTGRVSPPPAAVAPRREVGPPRADPRGSMAQQVPSAEVATEHSTPAGVVERESDAEPVREITEEVRNEDVTIGDASVQGNKQQKDTSAALAGTVLEGR
ncbi:MAG: hypothetical protein ACPHRO_10130, partial [Nannocystaceae bacterium]